ncbi:hypothetical protein NUSPORA_00873 [Nucleospora cyclopteri]
MGNIDSSIKKYFFIVKQTNKNLPLIPFIHCIKEVVVDEHYGGLKSISLCKEKVIQLEILDILTNEVFFISVGPEDLEENQTTLGISVAEVMFIPKIPNIRILSTKNPFFKEGDQILGIENALNMDVIEQIESLEEKRIVIARNNKVIIVEVSGKELGCEIGVGLLYGLNEDIELEPEEYTGVIKKLQKVVQSEKLSVLKEKKEVENSESEKNESEEIKKDNKLNEDLEKAKKHDFEASNPEENVKFVNTEEGIKNLIESDKKYVQGEAKEPEYAVLKNDLFTCNENYAKKGVLKEESFNENKLQCENVKSAKNLSEIFEEEKDEDFLGKITRKREEKQQNSHKPDYSEEIVNDMYKNEEEINNKFKNMAIKEPVCDFVDSDEGEFLPALKEGEHEENYKGRKNLNFLSSDEEDFPVKPKKCIHFSDCDCNGKVLIENSLSDPVELSNKQINLLEEETHSEGENI